MAIYSESLTRELTTVLWACKNELNEKSWY